MRPMTGRRLVDFVSGMAFLLVCMYWLNFVGPMVDPVWSATDREPIPRNFSYLLFPKPAASILDAKGDVVGPLRRAIAINDEQYRAGGQLRFGDVRVDLDALTPA